MSQIGRFTIAGHEDGKVQRRGCRRSICSDCLRTPQEGYQEPSQESGYTGAHMTMDDPQAQRFNIDEWKTFMKMGKGESLLQLVLKLQGWE